MDSYINKVFISTQKKENRKIYILNYSCNKNVADCPSPMNPIVLCCFRSHNTFWDIVHTSNIYITFRKDQRSKFGQYSTGFLRTTLGRTFLLSLWYLVLYICFIFHSYWQYWDCPLLKYFYIIRFIEINSIDVF